MATAQDIINRSLRLLGAIASGESPTAQESADALVALNNMLESWQLDRLTIYAYTDTSYTTVPSTATYTVGPSANFNLSPRPPKLENIFIRDGGYDYPVELFDEERWYAIGDKTEAGNPMAAYYEPSYPNGVIKLWPVPSSAVQLHIVTWVPVSTFAALSTPVALPQGYERALAYNLAVEIAPEYERQPAPSVVQIAAESLAAVKRANQRPIKSYTELYPLISPEVNTVGSL